MAAEGREADSVEMKSAGTEVMGRTVQGTLMATGSAGGLEKSHSDVTCSGHGPFPLTDGEARGEERLSRPRLGS